MNALGEEELDLSSKAKFMREALEEEAVLVFTHSLLLTEQDLVEVHQRLAGNQPLPDEITQVLQEDVEDRVEKLIAALDREQKRRRERRDEEQQEEEQQEQEEQPPEEQQQQENQQNRQRLVSITAELEMLKQMEEDMMVSTQRMARLFGARGEDLSDLDLALFQRLAHRHNGITEIYLGLKKQIEAALGGGGQ
jgi:hypothetical protein